MTLHWEAASGTGPCQPSHEVAVEGHGKVTVKPGVKELKADLGTHCRHFNASVMATILGRNSSVRGPIHGVTGPTGKWFVPENKLHRLPFGKAILSDSIPTASFCYDCVCALTGLISPSAANCSTCSPPHSSLALEPRSFIERRNKWAGWRALVILSDGMSRIGQAVGCRATGPAANATRH